MPTASMTNATVPTSNVTDAAIQRLNMVESQVRPSDVTDRRIIRAMSDLPRETFVPADSASLAYMDGPVPLAKGRNARQLMDARVYAKMLQLALIPDNAAVLEIGSGTGYGAALLSHFAKRVVAVESDAAMATAAINTLKSIGILTGVSHKTGPLHEGAADDGPYDAIIVAGSVAQIPNTLLDQLKDGGRLVAVRSTDAMSRATVWVRSGNNYDALDYFDATAAPLPGFEAPTSFKL